VTSVALIVIWVGNRNRERFLLQDALDLGDEKQKIEKLSRGADIYGKVSRSGANPGLLNFPRGETISVLEWFAKYEYTQVVAYLLLLEPDARRRAQLATKALTSAKDQTIAQKFIDLGGNPAENIQALLNSILDRRLNMFEFYITNGVKLHADIPNYQAWQKALDERQQHLGNTGDAENSNLDPHFRTPFEQMLDLNEKSKFRLEIRDILNATMSVVRGSYDYHTPQTLYAPQTLYESLNKSGIRIRREYVEKFFSQLNVSSE